MTEQNRKDKKDLQLQSPGKAADDKLDLGFQYLSNALRISFIFLKMIMIALVIFFLASGFSTIEPDEAALVLRLGKIRGVGEERILGPGLHWVLPYPIDEIVKIPVEKKVNLAINSFWYFQSGMELESPRTRKVLPSEPLYPLRDGYCITRSEKQSADIAGVDGSDYNIVHSKWQLTYQIVEPESFFKNVYVEELKPGQDYFNVMTKSINPLLKAVFDDAVVTAMVHYSIDEALSSQDRIPNHVKKLMQQKLEQQIESGIKVVQVRLIVIKPPRQVDRAFQDFVAASQKKEGDISKAKTYAGNTLNEAAGPVARELFDALHDETISEQEKELLWSQAAGAAQAKIARARAYATKIIEDAEADAEYLKTILPEYREHPEIVIQNIHRDAVVHVLENAKKVMIQPTEGDGGREIRIELDSE
ncbi:MAG: SPFH domain-containing protein [Planctomycetota bacterium]|jgi:membrane protease subunit HflK